MAKRILQFLQGVAVVLSVFSISASVHAQNSNVFHVAVDRITASGGDSATVSVRYVFNATKTHNLHSVTARLTYDSSLVRIVAVETAGTATSLLYILDTIAPSVIGFLGAGQSNQELDLTNPVLFRLKVVLNRNLSDTAWIRWDRSVAMFGDTSYGVDSLEQVDGWARSSDAFGHIVLGIPRIRVTGQSDGYTADSVRFTVPIVLSDVSLAGIQAATLSFSYDPKRMVFVGASTNGSADVGVGSILNKSGSLSVDLLAKAQQFAGGDTLLVLSFLGFVGTDTVTTSFQNLRWKSTNQSALRGNVDYVYDSIRFEGSFKKLKVMRDTRIRAFAIFPNPASDHVTFEPPDEADYAIKIYDALGAVRYESLRVPKVWEIPRGTAAGICRVVLEERNSKFQRVQMLVIGP